MVRLSIIIPAVGRQRDLEDTLVSVLSNRPRGSEVLVVFAGPYDDPYELRGEVRFVETDAKTDRVGLANAGIRASRGNILHLLSAEIDVVEGWTELPMQWFKRDSSVAAVSPLVIAADDHRRVVSAGVRCALGGRRKIVGSRRGASAIVASQGAIDGPTLSAGFYRRSAVVSAGGFDQWVGEQFADVDLAVALQHHGYGHIFEPDCRIFARGAIRGGARAGYRYGRFAERFFWRHASRRGRLLSLMTHLPHVVIEGLRQFPRPSAVTGLVGRLTGMWDVVRGTHRRVGPLDGEAKRQAFPTTRETKRQSVPLREAG